MMREKEPIEGVYGERLVKEVFRNDTTRKSYGILTIPDNVDNIDMEKLIVKKEANIIVIRSSRAYFPELTYNGVTIYGENDVKAFLNAL